MDPVRTAVMENRFTAIVEEASTTLHRTAHTTFVKLVQDYQCALATPEGEMFAYPTQSGVTVLVGMPLQTTLERIGRENFRPGDLYITNDPFYTDGLVTHIMDVTMIYPIFYGGELISYGWAFVHASDVGGAVPGSISPTFKEFFQEGIRVRPIKLYKDGELNEDAKNIFLDNTRIPEEMWGDFQAMIAALRSMERRLHQLCSRYGPDVVRQGMDDVISYGEMKSREVIASIPDGEFSFSDYIEGVDGGEHIHLRTTMRIEGDELELDFTGTDPQVDVAYNFIIGARTHPYVTQALTYFLLTNDPHMPMNAGILRPIRTIAPRGTVVNADAPAAMGSRVAAGTRLYDTVLGCLNQALPDGIIAAGAGMVGVIVCSARDRVSGRHRVSTLNPVMGGGGGRNGVDGIDGVDGRSGAIRNVPTEVIEAETVIHMRKVELVADSQGAGEWRSGAAIQLEMENTGVEATLTVRGMERFHFQPWGVRGGQPGRVCEVIKNPGRPEAASIGKITVLTLKKGEAVRILSPAGGGFGDPLDRKIKLIERDVKTELMTPEKAAADYGVVFTEGAKIDAAATEELREERRKTAEQELFNYGPTREAYDRKWPSGTRALLANVVLQLDKSIRRNVMDRAYSKLSEMSGPVTAGSIAEAIGEALGYVGETSKAGAVTSYLREHQAAELAGR